MFFRRVRESPSTDATLDELTGGTAEQPRAVRRRRHRLAVRALMFCVIVLAAFLGFTVGGIYVVSERLGGQIHRYPEVFGNLDEAIRPPVEPETKTFLIVGVDSRSLRRPGGDEPTGPVFASSAQRSDVIMLMRINPDRATGNVVSIPRDSWVTVPGRGLAKINSAYSFGGPSLLIRTVEALTNIRVDHFGVIDFAGFQQMTDALGGIDVNIAAPTRYGDVQFHAGRNHLDGRKALIYVRQRHDLPRGDLDRVRRQQNALRALIGSIASAGMLSDAARAYDLLNVVTRWIGVDDTLTNARLRSLAFEMRYVNASGINFLTAPVRGTGREGDQSVVYLDPGRATEFWHSFGEDDIVEYVKKYPEDVLGESPR